MNIIYIFLIDRPTIYLTFMLVSCLVIGILISFLTEVNYSWFYVYWPTIEGPGPKDSLYFTMSRNSSDFSNFRSYYDCNLVVK